MQIKNDKDNETIYKRAKYFKEERKSVHLVKKDKRFHNGKIIVIRPDFLILYDEKFGECPIFYEEILAIDLRIPKERIK